jgi:renal tumor antigen
MQTASVNEFRIIRKLGEGVYADVYMVKSLRDQNTYAEKRLKKRYRSFEEVSQLIEIIALRLVARHPNIVTLHSLMYDSQSGHVALIFELVDMNLLEFLTQQTVPLDEPSVLLLIYQLAKAINHVHSEGLFHRDIKPENCLVNSETLELKLADFGSAGQVANRTRFTEYVATRWYRAPECILTSGTYGPPVDVWALGCVLFEALAARPLFPGKHQLDQLNQIHSVLGTPSRDILAHFQQGMENSKVGFAFKQRPRQSFRNLLPAHVTDEVVDLIEKLIVYDPIDRITAHDALDHPAFRQLRRCDTEWENADIKMPFAVFFRNRESQPPAPLPVQPKIVSAAEARRLAVQKAIEYNKRQMVAQAEAQAQAHMGRPRPLQQPVFQKPRPEMIHPKLPLIIYRPLRMP